MPPMNEDQPTRHPNDGPVIVERPTPGTVRIRVDDKGKPPETIEVSLFNAFRLFGALAVALGVDLPARVARRIRML